MYKSDLEAAHIRIQQLESEVERLKIKKPIKKKLNILQSIGRVLTFEITYDRAFGWVVSIVLIMVSFLVLFGMMNSSMVDNVQRQEAKQACSIFCNSEVKHAVSEKGMDKTVCLCVDWQTRIIKHR